MRRGPRVARDLRVVRELSCALRTIAMQIESILAAAEGAADSAPLAEIKSLKLVTQHFHGPVGQVAGRDLMQGEHLAVRNLVRSEYVAGLNSSPPLQADRKPSSPATRSSKARSTPPTRAPRNRVSPATTRMPK